MGIGETGTANNTMKHFEVPTCQARLNGEIVFEVQSSPSRVTFPLDVE